MLRSSRHADVGSSRALNITVPTAIAGQVKPISNPVTGYPNGVPTLTLTPCPSLKGCRTGQILCLDYSLGCPPAPCRSKLRRGAGYVTYPARQRQPKGYPRGYPLCVHESCGYDVPPRPPHGTPRLSASSVEWLGSLGTTGAPCRTCSDH